MLGIDIEGQGQSVECQVTGVEDKQGQAQQEEVDPPRRGQRKRTPTEKGKGMQAEKKSKLFNRGLSIFMEDGKYKLNLLSSHYHK